MWQVKKTNAINYKLLHFFVHLFEASIVLSPIIQFVVALICISLVQITHFWHKPPITTQIGFRIFDAFFEKKIFAKPL
ncbi:MAG: hypothetical protein EAY66_06855 [Sphingobacteriales bacterium]|nr:MAG: hypothetical protein EAY66_06855 [Sphingobacteriales bacterium]